jgi:hypothetical protein
MTISARGILGDVAEGEPRVGNAVRLPGVLADEQGDLAVLEVSADGRAEHEAVDPDLAGPVLGDGARAVLGAEGPERGRAVEAAQVVALAAAAVVEDRLAVP